MKMSAVRTDVEYAAVPGQRGRGGLYRARYRIRVVDTRHHWHDRANGDYKPAAEGRRTIGQPAMLAEYLDPPRIGERTIVYAAGIDGPWDEWQAAQRAEDEARQRAAQADDRARAERDDLARRIGELIGLVGEVELWYSTDRIMLDRVAARALIELAEIGAPHAALRRR